MFRNPYTDGLIVLLIVLLFFGPKRLPTLGRSLGQGLREFKDSITGNSTEDDDEERPAIAASNSAAERPLNADAVPPRQAEPAPAQSAPPEHSSAEVGSGPAA
jgi:sec-independent protein translocase protein TatA